MTNRRKTLLTRQLIGAGRQLAAGGLTAARSGNLSCRLDDGHMLITATGAPLGSLRASDIVTVDLRTGVYAPRSKKPSSETPLHRAIYASVDCGFVIHCHPPLTNAYFAVNRSLEILTLETRLYLSRGIAVLPQHTVTVSRIAPVVRAVRTRSIAVLKNHGVVAVSGTFADALHPIEVLEEAVKVAAIARLLKTRGRGPLNRTIKRCLYRRSRTCR